MLPGRELCHVCVQVSIDGLRSVPLDILKRLDSVPEAYLQELGDSQDLFAELPVAVQRQASLSPSTLSSTSSDVSLLLN